MSRTIGGALVVTRGGEIVYERYYGYRDKANLIPVTEDTYFRIASVTKMVSGIGLLQLVEQGRAALDEDIGTYFGYEIRNTYYPDVPRHAASADEPHLYVKHRGRLRQRETAVRDALRGSAPPRQLYRQRPRQRIRVLQLRRGRGRGRAGSRNGHEREPLYARKRVRPAGDRRFVRRGGASRSGTDNKPLPCRRFPLPQRAQLAERNIRRPRRPRKPLPHHRGQPLDTRGRPCNAYHGAVRKRRR